MSLTKRSLNLTPEILERLDRDTTSVWLPTLATLDPQVVGFILGISGSIAHASHAVNIVRGPEQRRL